MRSGLAAGQVLQRGKDGASVTVSGYAQNDGAVFATVSRAGKALEGFNGIPAGKAANGAFTAKLRRIPAGGPYEVTLECRYALGALSMLTVSDVWVGDLWLLAGQSNMA